MPPGSPSGSGPFHSHGGLDRTMPLVAPRRAGPGHLPTFSHLGPPWLLFCMGGYHSSKHLPPAVKWRPSCGPCRVAVRIGTAQLARALGMQLVLSKDSSAGHVHVNAALPLPRQALGVAPGNNSGLGNCFWRPWWESRTATAWTFCPPRTPPQRTPWVHWSSLSASVDHVSSPDVTLAVREDAAAASESCGWTLCALHRGADPLPSWAQRQGSGRARRRDPLLPLGGSWLACSCTHLNVAVSPCVGSGNQRASSTTSLLGPRLSLGDQHILWPELVHQRPPGSRWAQIARQARPRAQVA